MVFITGIHLGILLWKCYIQLVAGKEYPYYDEKTKVDDNTRFQDSGDTRMYNSPDNYLSNYLPVDILDDDDIEDISPQLSSAFIGYFKMRAQQLEAKFGRDLEKVGSDTETDMNEHNQRANGSKKKKYLNIDERLDEQDMYDTVLPVVVNDYTNMRDYPINGDIITNKVITYGEGAFPREIGLGMNEIPNNPQFNFGINESEAVSEISPNIEIVNEELHTPEVEASNTIGDVYTKMNNIPVSDSRFLNEIPAINESELADVNESLNENGITDPEMVEQREALPFNNTDEPEGELYISNNDKGENGSYLRHRRSLYSFKKWIQHHYGNDGRMFAALARVSARRRSVLDPLASNIIG